MSDLPTIGRDVVCGAVKDGAVLFSAPEEVYYGLNRVGALVWDLLPQSGSLDELCRGVRESFPSVDLETIRTDVTELLEDLERYGLVTSNGRASAE